MTAYVNGYKAIIYGYTQSGIFMFCDCYFPELGIREPVISSDIYLR